MPLFKIKHTTRYRYSSPAVDCANQIMLYPIQDNRQSVKTHHLTISAAPQVETFIDYFGNKLGMFSLLAPHRELVIVSDAEVVTTELPLPEDLQDAAKQWTQLSESCRQVPYIDFLQLEDFDSFEELKALIDTIYDVHQTPFANARLFSSYVYKHFEYKKGITSVETDVNEIWKLKAGVCQDFAHFLLLMLRRTGIPARYVSGYICPRSKELRGEGATHAWVEAYVPDYGWLGLDPTNNCIAGDRHIRLAVGRNFSDVTPVKGTYKGSSDHVLEVSVSIDDREVIPTVADQGITTQEAVDQPSRNSYRRYMEQVQQQQ
ncbi:transglutaminase family protein [Niabella terrae]